MTTPSQSALQEVPQWANQASGVRYAVTVRLRKAEECLRDYDTDPMMQDIAQRARDDRDSAKVVLAFIDDPLTKHAAALSEENERLKAQLALQNAPHDHDHLPSHAQLMEENERLRGEVERLNNLKESAELYALEYRNQATVLRQWTEQARESMEATIKEGKSYIGIGFDTSNESASLEWALAGMRSVLAAHPADTRLRTYEATAKELFPAATNLTEEGKK